MVYFSKYWWTLALRSLFLLVFGVIAVTAPNMPTETLVFYLGFFSLAMMAMFFFLLVNLFKAKGQWMPFLLLSVFDAVLAYYCLLETALAAKAFLTIIAIWALFMGGGIMLLGIKNQGTGRALMLINGLLSVVFGFFVFYNPLKSTSVNFMVGFYTILLSLFLVYLTYRLVKLGKTEKARPPAENQANK